MATLYIPLLMVFLTAITGCRYEKDPELTDPYDAKHLERLDSILNDIKSDYISHYGATRNLLHFTKYLHNNHQDTSENAGLLAIFLQKIMNGDNTWNDMTEDPLIYFAQDFEVTYQRWYPRSVYDSVVTSTLYAFYLSEERAKTYPLVVTDQERRQWNIGDFEGSMVVLDFWATWCIPCREQMPYMEKLKARFQGREDLIFITVNMDEEKEKWTAFIERHTDHFSHEITARLPLEEGDEQAGDMGITNLPTYVIIGKDGRYLTKNGPKPAARTFARIIENHL